MQAKIKNLEAQTLAHVKSVHGDIILNYISMVSLDAFIKHAIFFLIFSLELIKILKDTLMQ